MTGATTARVELQGISKSFPGVRALDNVDFRLEAGQIHALLGENGAGKSTLIKIMTGALQRDAGKMLLDGAPYEIASPAEAHALGISTVYQEVNLIPTLSVAKNLTLERQPTRFGLISWKLANQRARERLARLKLDIDVERPLAWYPVAIQQLIAIARALEENTRVLVLDEPTASLDARETELLFEIMRELKARGIAVIFITHFIDQVCQIADRITVLRNGRLVGTAPTAELPRIKLVAMMLGRELAAVEAKRTVGAVAATGEPILAAEGVGRRRYMGDFSLQLRPGEVVGLAGLLGSGRTETCKLVFGAVRADHGQIRIEGKPIAVRSPGQAVRMDIGFCPEDRKAEGLISELTVRENIVLALQVKRGWWRRLPHAEQEKVAQEIIKLLAIATPDADKQVGQLSGGNQQKVILGRWLASQSRILILDEPTRGIDVGAHAEVVSLIRRLAGQGMALLVASSELDEIVTVSDRVEVLRDRHQVGEIAGADVTRENIIHTIAAG